VIEHTNFVDAAGYGGRYIVYLSRYCVPDDPFLAMSDHEALEYALPYLKRMFPHLTDAMILGVHSWKAEHAQPIVEVGYASRVPSHITPIKGVCLTTMAQIYPQDRGTNYAIRDGRKVACLLLSQLDGVESARVPEPEPLSSAAP
jgi:protoporphyrinogen oxidase